MTTNPTHIKFLLVTKGWIRVTEHTDLQDALNEVMNLKYPAGFISLTVMEDVDGPY